MPTDGLQLCTEASDPLLLLCNMRRPFLVPFPFNNSKITTLVVLQHAYFLFCYGEASLSSIFLGFLSLPVLKMRGGVGGGDKRIFLWRDFPQHFLFTPGLSVLIQGNTHQRNTFSMHTWITALPIHKWSQLLVPFLQCEGFCLPLLQSYLCSLADYQDIDKKYLNCPVLILDGMK